ncbi:MULTISPECIES: DUF1120 domain-containing protein [unclassified Pseudomonas]|uniref:DUF1120 domain-containing protein n=1 Tax=unclassified Pseudomonas TaxID=196821 RepID=UPI001CBC92AF|nr:MULTISPECIES: DUF1120 domain-containing protein [unclassified Pseudomonas]
MNKRLSLLTAALLLTGASSAFAASSTDLTVTGRITPTACTPSLANSGVVDFGKTSATDLHQTNWTFLGRPSLKLNVDCDAAQTYALHLKDNRENTAFRSHLYGLGLINTNQKLGGFDLGFSSAVSENGSIDVLISADQGTTWSPSVVAGHVPGTWAAFGDRSTGTLLPTPIKNLTVDMEVGAIIARADSLTLTDEVRLDGAATLEVIYL